jgi:hypothetical protein
VAVGTTSPYAKLSVAGTIAGHYFDFASTSATSTIAGGISVGNGALAYDYSGAVTSIDYLQVGATSFDTDAGVISWTDLPVTSSAASGTPESYTAQIDGNPVLTVYGESDAAGAANSLRVGVSTTSPWRVLSVQGTVAFSGLTSSSGSPNTLCVNATTKEVTENAASSCTVSSARFKNDIATSTTGLGVVLALRPVSFKYNGNDQRERLGLIAEDVDKIDKRLVFYDSDGLTPRGVRYEELTSVLARAIQDINSIINLEKATTTIPSIIVDGSGNIGVGTSTPAYKLHVIGDVAATSFVNISTREAKKDISTLSDEDDEQVLKKIDAVNVARYKYVYESDDAPLRLGLIAEDAPKEVLAAGGKGVDIYKLSSFILAGVKAQQKKLADLEMRITALEARSFTNSGGISIDSVLERLASFGAKIESGVTYLKRLVAETLDVKELTVKGDDQSKTGITIYDRVTGEPVCVFVASGVMTTEKGICGGGDSNSVLSGGTPSGDPGSATSTTPTDTEPPVITVNGNNPARIEKGSHYVDLGASVSDNVSQNLGIIVEGDQIDTAIVGTYYVKYSATDQAGNVGRGEREVIVFDPALGEANPTPPPDNGPSTGQ